MSDSEWHVVSKPKKNNPALKAQSLSQQSVQYHQQRMHQGGRRHHGGMRSTHLQQQQQQQQQQRHQEQTSLAHTSEDASSPQHHYTEKEDNRKSFAECGFTDTKQIRRMVPHLETIANYSKGGIIGALRGKMIHNSEDREQRIGILQRDVKLTSQEQAFVQHLVQYCSDNDTEALGFSREDEDTLLGFLTIVLSCIAHTRYYKSSQPQQNRDGDAGDEPEEREAEAEEDNYHIYHESMKEVQVWKMSQIASNLSESLRRDLQQKFDTNPPVLDAQTLQKLLLGDGFKFDYAGNLSVPYCLEVLHEHLNCNESKTVRQRRSLYRHEQKPAGSRGPAPERSAWRSPSVQKARDYKSQVEAFESQYLEGEGIATDGTSTLSSLLHSVYTSFLKIRKKQTPKDLLERLRTLLLALPNLIQLPELLQQVKGDSTWVGCPSIEEYPDLPDYKELKQRLEKYLEKEGIKKASQDEDQISVTLKALYNFNKVEQEKLDAYLNHLRREAELAEDENSEDATAEESTPAPPKGYPLEARYIEAFLDQLKVKNNKTYQKELDQLAPFRE